ncbi:MAG: T9SS type A sorting domain-containing protein [Bacteroidetes bacterium]|nr:T9SS type A sorting domain-containing protein [Bacteroidota bacterium]
MKNRYFALLVILTIFAFSALVGRSFRVGKVPNGSVNACANCHVDPQGGGARNDFGQAVESRVTPNGQENFWGADLAAIDSDGDGFTNGEELQDAGGAWTSGTIGDPSLVTNPGDINSHPAPTGIEGLTELPSDFILSQNYPNPFNPSTKISYFLPEPSHVKLEVYNSIGQLIRVLADANLAAGSHVAFWDANDQFGYKVSSGIYIYRISAGDFSAGSGNEFVESKTMVLMK